MGLQGSALDGFGGLGMVRNVDVMDGFRGDRDWMGTVRCDGVMRWKCVPERGIGE